MATTDKGTLEQKVLPELQQIASSLGVEGHQRLKKGELIDAIIAAENGKGAGRASAEGKTEAPARAETPTRTDQRETLPASLAWQRFPVERRCSGPGTGPYRPTRQTRTQRGRSSVGSRALSKT